MKNKQITSNSNFSEVADMQGRQASYVEDTEALYPSIFQDGADGDLILSSGFVTFTRDMYYNNLTINGTRPN